MNKKNNENKQKKKHTHKTKEKERRAKKKKERVENWVEMYRRVTKRIQMRCALAQHSIAVRSFAKN